MNSKLHYKKFCNIYSKIFFFRKNCFKKLHFFCTKGGFGNFTEKYVFLQYKWLLWKITYMARKANVFSLAPKLTVFSSVIFKDFFNSAYTVIIPIILVSLDFRLFPDCKKCWITKIWYRNYVLVLQILNLAKISMCIRFLRIKVNKTINNRHFN